MNAVRRFLDSRLRTSKVIIVMDPNALSERERFVIDMERAMGHDVTVVGPRMIVPAHRP